MPALPPRGRSTTDSTLIETNCRFSTTTLRNGPSLSPFRNSKTTATLMRAGLSLNNLVAAFISTLTPSLVSAVAIQSGGMAAPFYWESLYERDEFHRMDRQDLEPGPRLLGRFSWLRELLRHEAGAPAVGTRQGVRGPDENDEG